MIEIKNLYKRYHNHHGSDWVLRDINLTIPAGVSVGLIGANGAGKSTLLRLIAGMDTPERGEVIRHSRVSWPVGLSGGMQGSMTGRQNVKFVARAQGRSNEVDDIVNFVEDFAEIGASFDEPVKTYSSGMRSRLSFGLSFAFDFDVYISDEATAVGDRAFKKKAQRLFNQKVDKSSLIMVSHSEGILRELCDSGIYLKNKEAIWYDNINDAIYDYHIDTNKGFDAEEYLSLEDKVSKNNQNDLDYLEKSKKSYNKKANDLWQAVRKLKDIGGSKEQIDIINKHHKKWKSDLAEINEKIRKTSSGRYKELKQDLNNTQRSIDALSMTLRQIELKDQGLENSLLISSLELLEKYKNKLVIEIEKYDELD
ncbi:ATP-binding cassette domain-containing protein [Cobetia sp. 14N.309.X.WAT.E.A4]|uniref:ABC transporter ATP-binding protein n=1 Tax=Cobetia sp. 14N.309.X.WAT.E.A4 TaxID=2998323 RepID=UPI0025AF9C57|nr:ATP-binding cassette domain-containing protein [Cobetia sp. 14N.309.X.WAT.E.A4]MDN2656481.1 ATP-binding cassette domain-containing protein [Cobetia sp. 14N.309.X.WAT.E.A4]